jgi:hypothetical protein
MSYVSDYTDHRKPRPSPRHTFEVFTDGGFIGPTAPSKRLADYDHRVHGGGVVQIAESRANVPSQLYTVSPRYFAAMGIPVNHSRCQDFTGVAGQPGIWTGNADSPRTFPSNPYFFTNLSTRQLRKSAA